MEASVLIVSKNRYAALHKTLGILQNYLDLEKHEILVFLDGCSDGSEGLNEFFPKVKWEISQVSYGASKARNILYKKAKGQILFGFDDDAHPLQKDFIIISQKLFADNKNLGILAFKEIKGIFNSAQDIPKQVKEDYLVKEFLGCGFAIKKEVYSQTMGFPVWVDIYGEETCVAMETLDLGKDILFTHRVCVNHRKEKQQYNLSDANYFRFGKQLKNTAAFYLVYYPFPLLIKKILKLYLLNFLKYAVKDRKFLIKFIEALFENFRDLKKNLRYRNPVSLKTIKRFNNLPNPTY